MTAWKYTRQCTHLHHSGRQCGERVSKHKEGGKCVPHTLYPCVECQTMLERTKPKTGWKEV